MNFLNYIDFVTGGFFGWELDVFDPSPQDLVACPTTLTCLIRAEGINNIEFKVTIPLLNRGQYIG